MLLIEHLYGKEKTSTFEILTCLKKFKLYKQYSYVQDNTQWLSKSAQISIVNQSISLYWKVIKCCSSCSSVGSVLLCSTVFSFVTLHHKALSRLQCDISTYKVSFILYHYKTWANTSQCNFRFCTIISSGIIKYCTSTHQTFHQTKEWCCMPQGLFVISCCSDIASNHMKNINNQKKNQTKPHQTCSSTRDRALLSALLYCCTQEDVNWGEDLTFILSFSLYSTDNHIGILQVWGSFLPLS